MEQLINHLKNIITLSDNDILLLENCCKRVSVKKGTVLLKEGRVAQKIYYIEKGLLCGKLNLNGKEIINWIGYENIFSTSLSSFIGQKKSYENIEAIEDCLLYEITYENLQKLYKNIPALEKTGRLTVEQYYVLLEQRSMSLQYLSAKERYDQFLKDFPELYQRISLGQLSSYLGISQETLSRIRAKK